MRWLARWRAGARERLRVLFFRKRIESDMDDELRFHIEMEAEKLVRSDGLSLTDARRTAAVAFGGVQRYKEEVRDARGLAWLGGTRLDFTLGLRMLAKYPMLSLVGGLGMAVAIAISVGFFAFLGAHMYPAIPLEEGDRIVALENRDIEVNNEERRALHDFVLWRDELRSVQELGAFRTVERNAIPRDGSVEPVQVAEMTANGFRVARVPPLMGRYLVEDDERAGAPPVVVIGYDVWRERFASDPAVVGRELRFGATVHTIVGVMPAGFAFPMSHEYWTPLRANPADYPRRDGPEIYIFGRLAPGVTMKEAQAELETIGQRTAAAFPESNGKLVPMIMPYTHSLTDIQGTTTWMAVQMELMVTILLVVVALNVAVLIYARTATRQGEIAVRMALGASRHRIVAQLFVEALVLSAGAALLGLAIAQFGLRIANSLMESELGSPFWMDYSLHPLTALYTVGLAIVAAVIVGIIPALQATGRSLQHDVRQLGGGTGMRLGRTWTVLIVAQVAIAVAALPAAVAMGWGEIRSATTRPAYPPEEFLLAELQPEPVVEADVVSNPQPAQARFGERLTEVLQRLNADPAVAGATFQATLPGRGGRIEIDGMPTPPDVAGGHRVSSIGIATNYLDVFGSRVLTGRGFESQDTDAGATSVIVTQAFVRQVLDGGNALGRRIRHVVPPADLESGAAQPGPWYEIVGVAEDLQVNVADPDLVRPAMLYAVSPTQAPSASLEVRLRGTTPTDFAPRLRQIAVEVDPTLQLGTTYSLAEFERQDQLAVRLVGLVIGLVLVSVFLLSAAGVYALTSLTVTRRRREIGIRVALGATPRQVLGSVFARVAQQIALGLAVGIAAAALIDGLSGGEMMAGRARVLLPVFGVLMAIVAILAAFGPARRGLRIEPTEALRGDA